MAKLTDRSRTFLKTDEINQYKMAILFFSSSPQNKLTLDHNDPSEKQMDSMNFCEKLVDAICKQKQTII